MMRSRSISMAPKRHHIPFLLLSLLALFLFSHYFLFPRPSLSIASPHALSHRSSSRFSLTVKVLAYDRLSSLSRCLRSLSAADYGGDAVHLHIYIDHFKQPDAAQSVDVEDKLRNSRRILDFVDGFDWKSGQKLVHYRTVNVGLQAQWLEAWWPSSDDEFVFVVEDDLEVSPLYYGFLKGLVMNYYYNQSNFSPFVYGASLQRPRFVPGKHGNKMHLDHDTRLFLYPLVGTWGQLLFPKPWKEFRMWYDIHKAKGIKPFLDGMITTGWYKKMGERIWTPWFIKFIHSRGYFNIYTNLLNERALSVSHRDAGVNYGKTAGPDSYLVNETNIDFNLMDMTPLNDLKWYDFCFRQVLPRRVVKTVSEVGILLSSMQKQRPVIIVSLFKASESITRNQLCHFERLNVQNYLLVGPNSDFLLDLARRGHPVIDADQFFESLKSSLRNSKSDSEPIKEIIVDAFITKKCLEAGLDTYILNAKNMLLVNIPLLAASPLSDFYESKASGALYVRSSSSSRKAWEIALSQALASAETSIRNFTGAMVKLLEKQGAKYNTLDDTNSIVELGSSSVESPLGDATKIIHWSSDGGSDVIKERLTQLGIWIIDVDMSCNGVFCHRG